MAEFTTDLQSIPFVDIAPNMELMINQYAADDQFNSSVLDYSSLNFHSYMPVSTDNNYYTNQGTEFQGNLEQNFPSFVDQDIERNWNNEAPSKKRIAVDDVSESSSRISTPSVSETGIKRKNSSGRGKRVKSDEKEDDTEKEVVHVRARRGQATDSHSLAERVRRGKINERLRCLQNIVPGCSNSKPVGMAVMLDEIINYVQSLQNQIEFLSMKLTAASSFSDFNSETYDIYAMQRGNIYEVTKMEGLKREEEYASSFHCNQFDLSDFNFGR